jgi:hypothetical protein
MTEAFEIIFARDTFEGLKRILDRMAPDREALRIAIQAANDYEDLLARLGYRLQLVKQIHVQDAFSRLGAAGGIKAVLPHYDIPTQSSHPTLIHFDSSISTTAKAVAFFNQNLTLLQKELKTRG